MGRDARQQHFWNSTNHNHATLGPRTKQIAVLVLVHLIYIDFANIWLLSVEKDEFIESYSLITDCADKAKEMVIVRLGGGVWAGPSLAIPQAGH